MRQLNERAQPPCQCLQFQQQQVYLRKIHNMNGPTLWHGWYGFEQRIINNATDEWCKHLWVSCARSIVSSLSSSETMCQLNERAQPPCQTPTFMSSDLNQIFVWTQWTTKFAHKFSCGSASENFMALSSASSLTLQSSGVHVSWLCVYVKERLSEYSIWLQILHLYNLMC